MSPSQGTTPGKVRNTGITPSKENLKRIVMIAVSMGVFAIDCLRRAMYVLIGKKMPATAVVLAYHSITSGQRAAFARQMDALVRCSKPSRADDFVFPPNGGRYTSVTFDDGYQNIVDNAIPELAQRRIPATIFVVAGALGEIPGWEDYADSYDPDLHDPIVTAENLRSLPFDLVQIGSHTITHPNLPQLAEKQARAQLSGSRAILKEITGQEVRLFSFPYGSANAKLVEWCRDEGYQRVYITHPSSALSRIDDLVVRRIKADPEDWPLEFQLKLYGTYRWRNRWRGSASD
jgi:peptidoglycan/xylan/chitin deacetylase (PgdA/CDA1 family)